jgi:hypothetical protein
MDDLITWLRTQLDRRERQALAASPGLWRPNAEHDEVVAADDVTVADGFALSGPQLRATVDHIADNDPDAVLREVEAKRRLVELHQPANPDDEPREGTPGWPGRPWHYCRTCGSGEAYEYPTDWPCATVRLLALPFSDRPGYREEWKP